MINSTISTISRTTCIVVALMLVSSGCASSPRQVPDGSGPAQRVGAGDAARMAEATVDSAQLAASRPDSMFTPPDASRLTTLTSGVMYYDVVVGTGPAAVPMRELEVHYVGKLQNGRIFDASLRRATSFKFVLGQRRVIRGWEAGVRGMRAGGRRILVVPPELGYGAAGSPPNIPPNATLLFDLQLIGVK